MRRGKLMGLVRWAGALVGGEAPVQWVPEHRLGAFWVGVGRRVVADRAGRRGSRVAQANAKADAAAASIGRAAESERRREEAAERAVRMAGERAGRAQARASTSGQIAGAKRGAVDVGVGTRTLRRRDAPGAAAVAAAPQGAVAGRKRGTRAVNATGSDGGPSGATAEGGRARRREQ